MKTHFKLILFLFTIFFVSCMGQLKDIDCETLSVDVNLSTSTNLTDLFTLEKCVVLETDSLNLIHHIFSLKIKNDSIYLLSGKKLLLFNDSGTFISQVNSIGSGPEEMLFPSDFTINDKNNEVGIMDNMKSEIVYYSNHAKFIKRKKLPVKFVTNFFEDRNNDLFIISLNTPQGRDRYALYILDSSFKIKQKELPFLALNEWLRVLDYNCFPQYNGNNYLKLPFNNLIYELTGNELKPYLKIDFGGNTIPEEFLNKFNQSNYIDFPKAIAAQKYVELNTFQEFTDAYYLTYNYKSEQWVHLISKRTLRHKIYKPNRFDFLSCIVPRFIYKDCVIGVIEPADLAENLQRTLPAIRNQFKNEYDYWSKISKLTKASDNPMLVYMKIKNF